MFLTKLIQKIAVVAGLCMSLYVSHAQEASVQPKNYYTSDFVIDGIPRYIAFYIPGGYGKNDTYPVLFMLHAENETGRTMVKKYSDELERLADSTTCIIVYPDAVSGHWNTKTSVRTATDSINDVGFISIMIDYFIQQYKADPGRVFATGINNGGQMAWRLACSKPKRMAAIAPFIASIEEAQKSCPVDSIPVFNGSKYIPQPGKKISPEALTDAFNFLLKHPAY